ncbi:hypothetical protein F4819DRAFT_58182 [Hypoxylon fuscum]|nr:hypothetical protein F4819DRAFT_58182 [Hypoxylon fuscum]
MDAPIAANFPDKATFGFELEFLMLFRESGTTAPLEINGQRSQPPRHIPEEPYGLVKGFHDEHDMHIKRLHYFGGEIAKVLTETGIVTDYRKKGHPKDNEALNIEDSEPRLGDFAEFCYSTYKQNTIVPEETMIWTDPGADGRRMAVRPETHKGYFWLGFEFVSKTYRYRDFESMKSDLESICRTLRSNYLVSINAGKDSGRDSSRCAIHIHWGLSGEEYNLVTIQRLLTFLWIAEDKLMGLHAAWRQDTRKYAALLQKGTNMATDNISKLPNWVDNPGRGGWVHEMERNVPAGLRESLHRGRPKIGWLWRAETMEDLARLVGEDTKSRRASVAITELLPATSDFPGKARRSQLNTVEFRHMQGSLHPALIAAWIEATSEIMRRCVESSPRDFTSFLEDVTACVSGANDTAHELLGKLGVAPETCSIFKEFDQQRLDEEADPNISLFLV